MRLLVCSLPDKASMNIRDAVLSLAEWSERGRLEGRPVYVSGNDMLVTIEKLHLWADDIDKYVGDSVGERFEEVVFLSRHKASSGIHTLTVHPIGNYSKAEYGGMERVLVPASPHSTTSILRRMKAEASDLPFEVSFEVTHHGPYLETPALFVEIGSDESMWEDRQAARAIASSVINPRITENPIAIGIGGGHYAPRFTEIATSKRISFGHMIPNYVIDHADEKAASDLVRIAAERSCDASLAYVHRKSMRRSRVTVMKNVLDRLGIAMIDSDSLVDI